MQRVFLQTCPDAALRPLRFGRELAEKQPGHGIGASEVEHVLATQTLIQSRQRTCLCASMASCRTASPPRTSSLPSSAMIGTAGRYQRHPPGGHFRQNLDPLQVTFAHRNQSHPQSPRSSKPGESDIPTLQDQDTSTLRCELKPRSDLRVPCTYPPRPHLREQILAEHFGWRFVS